MEKLEAQIWCTRQGLKVIPTGKKQQKTVNCKNIGATSDFVVPARNITKGALFWHVFILDLFFFFSSFYRL